jgi:deoxycytidylate deaminase
MKSKTLATKSPLKKCILKQAYAVAMSSDAPKKIGAILLKKNRIVSSAVNDYRRTHPVQYWAAKNASMIFNEPHLEKKVFLHAEIRSLIKAKEDSDTIIVCRVGGHGGKELRDSRPCMICSEYIRSCSNVIHIHYSTPQGFMYEYWGD